MWTETYLANLNFEQPGAHHIPRPKGDEDYESMTDIDRLSVSISLDNNIDIHDST
jgi:hypothetical protein